MTFVFIITSQFISALKQMFLLCFNVKTLKRKGSSPILLIISKENEEEVKTKLNQKRLRKSSKNVLAKSEK